MTAVGVAVGAATGFGIVLVGTGWERRIPTGRARRRIKSRVVLERNLGRSISLGLLVLVVTRWPVAAIAAAVLGWYSSALLGGRATREAGVARTEAIATWTEMMRDTIAAAHGLEAAIAATAPVAPIPIRSEVLALAVALERESLPQALYRFVEDLAHPIADLVVASLTVAASGSVRELNDLLGTLAASARDEAAMQLRIDAARARMRTAVRVITSCTIVTAIGLVALNPSYATVYSSALGQMVLALIATCWGLALWWLARMGNFQSPERFLIGNPTTTDVQP